jgi:hypothetical protein
LHFYRVISADIPKKALKEWLLDSEVHLVGKHSGEWRARLERSELRILAADVAYFINHEPLA